MLKSVLKATAALAVLAGSSTALGQSFCQNPGLFIPDNPSVMTTMNVAGGPASISVMAVTINLNHTWDSDVSIMLVHNGVTLSLTDENGGAGDNYIDTRFIDAAAMNITGGTPPFTGDFQPEGGDPFWGGTIPVPATYLVNLAGFNGMNGNGDWDLVIDDTVGGDVGTLNSWCIDFNPGAPPPPPPPPPNDDCAGSQAIGDGAWAFTTVNSTTDSFWPCAGGGRDIHFTYTATGTGTAIFSTCGAAGYDTAIMLGTSCGASDIVCLDDFCGLQTQVSAPVTPGTVIHVTVGGYASNVGSGTLNVSTVAPPANDDCGGSEAIGDGSYPFTTIGATTSGSYTCSFNPGNDVHFTFTAPITGNAIFDACSSNFAVVLLAGTTCGASDLGCFDACDGVVPVTAGQIVHVTVGGYNAGSGSGTLNVATVLPPPNDDCANTQAITDGSYPFTTVGSSTDSSFPCGAGGSDIHFVYTAAAAGAVSFSTCGSGYDTVLMLGTSCGASDLGCLDDSCGLQTTLSTCVTAGQVVHLTIGGFVSQTGSGTLTVTSASPPANDECTNPVPVGEGTFPYDNTGACSQGAASCGFAGSPGYNDIYFAYTPTFTGYATVSTCGQTFHDTLLSVYDDCNGTEIACNDDNCGTLQSEVCPFPVTANDTVIIRVASWAAAAYGSGTFTIASAAAPGPYSHPGSGSDEPEPCAWGVTDVYNGGCNSNPNVFGSISCGETIRGTAWCNPSDPTLTRDTDWYEFTLAADATVTFTGQAEFGIQTYLLSVSCPGATLLNGATNGCSSDFTMSSPLTAGTYVLFAATVNFTDTVTCGSGDRYWVTMTTDVGCGSSCDGDVNCDGNLDGFDVEVMERATGGDMVDFCQLDPDFNHDGNLDGFDVEAVEIVTGGGPCP